MADLGNIGREQEGGPNAAPPRIPDHELLHPIGRGSYGEVWLARNATGTLRAVKIVHRARFDDERPYEREFTGLKHFEPISRTHEGLVDVLQVGRNDAEGFFYYIMEADDAQSPANPTPAATPTATPPPATATKDKAETTTVAGYRPCTLESRIRAEGRLPARECVRVCAILADALKSLHALGLVHRDIKPSNIIFVEGIPKLADVGLVARSDSARTFVGTEGFVPPEGPGTVQADIYSLGKCLYEMAMGKDRQSFPSPPTLLAELPDREQLLELNEILDRACAPEPKERYGNADRLLKDCTTLSRGSSIRRKRMTHRWATAAALLSVAFLILIIAVSTRKPQTPRLELVMERPSPTPNSSAWVQFGDYRTPREPRLFFQDDMQLCITSLDGKILAANRWAPHDRRVELLGSRLLETVDGAGSVSFVLALRFGTNLSLQVLDDTLRTASSIGDLGGYAPSTRELASPLPSSRIIAWATFPSEGSLPPRLLTEVQHGFVRLPRALRMRSLTGKTLWEFPMAGSAHAIRCADLNGDGLQDFLVGTSASCNGVVLSEGRDDNHSELIALDHYGQLLWSTNLGGAFTVTEPMFVPAQQGRQAAVLASCSRTFAMAATTGQSESGSVFKFNTAGKMLASSSSVNEVSSLACASLHVGEPSTILTTDSCARLSVLDFDSLQLKRRVWFQQEMATNNEATESAVDFDTLKRIQTTQLTPGPPGYISLRIAGVTDLRKDGHPKIVLITARAVLAAPVGHVPTPSFPGLGDLQKPPGELIPERSTGVRALVLDESLVPIAQADLEADSPSPTPPQIHIIERGPKERPLLFYPGKLLRFFTLL